MKKYPEDSERFQRALEQRRAEFDVEHTVRMIGVERRARERRIAEYREAKNRALDMLARLKPLSDRHAAEVMARARAHLGKRDKE